MKVRISTVQIDTVCFFTFGLDSGLILASAYVTRGRKLWSPTPPIAEQEHDSVDTNPSLQPKCFMIMWEVVCGSCFARIESKSGRQRSPLRVSNTSSNVHQPSQDSDETNLGTWFQGHGDTSGDLLWRTEYHILRVRGINWHLRSWSTLFPVKAWLQEPRKSCRVNMLRGRLATRYLRELPCRKNKWFKIKW